MTDTSTCAFGTPFVHHFDGTGCPGCETSYAGIDARFAAAVARGEYDEQGYTPQERKTQAKRRRAA